MSLQRLERKKSSYAHAAGEQLSPSCTALPHIFHVDSCRSQKPWYISNASVDSALIWLQNDFSLFGFKFTSERPVPIDSLITNLAETAYVVSFPVAQFSEQISNRSKHPWIAASHLRWFVSDFIIKRVLWLLTGTAVCGSTALFQLIRNSDWHPGWMQSMGMLSHSRDGG